MTRRTVPGEVTDASADAEGRLSRWSRRKAAARAGQLDEEAEAAGAEVAADAASSEAVPAASADDLPAIDETDDPVQLPALESLDENSDYSAFMSEKVPKMLRSQALRQLFASAKFNIVDGLDDYDDDFRQSLPLGDIVTSDMRHQAELEAERARKAAEARTAELGESAPDDADGESVAEAEAAEEDADDADIEQGDSDASQAAAEPAGDAADAEPSIGGESDESPDDVAARRGPGTAS